MKIYIKQFLKIVSFTILISISFFYANSAVVALTQDKYDIANLASNRYYSFNFSPNKKLVEKEFLIEGYNFKNKKIQKNVLFKDDILKKYDLYPVRNLTCDTSIEDKFDFIYGTSPKKVDEIALDVDSFVLEHHKGDDEYYKNTIGITYDKKKVVGIFKSKASSKIFASYMLSRKGLEKSYNDNISENEIPEIQLKTSRENLSAEYIFKLQQAGFTSKELSSLIVKPKHMLLLYKISSIFISVGAFLAAYIISLRDNSGYSIKMKFVFIVHSLVWIIFWALSFAMLWLSMTFDNLYDLFIPIVFSKIPIAFGLVGAYALIMLLILLIKNYKYKKNYR